MSVSNIQNSIKSAGFSGVANGCHISKYDFCGNLFLEARENCQDNEIDPFLMKLIGQLDNMTIDEDNE